MYPRRGRGYGPRGRGGFHGAGPGGRGGFRGASRGGGRGFRGAGRRGRGGQARQQDCFDYLLLGECDRQTRGECHFAHSHTEKTVSETVVIPPNVPMATALTRDFMRLLKGIATFRLRFKSENIVEIVVKEGDAHCLPELKKEYNILLSQLYPIGPGWCYIHREGVEMCETGSLLKFRRYEGRIPLAPGQPSPTQIVHEIYITSEANSSDDGACGVLDMKPPARMSDTKEGLHRAIDRVHGDREPFDPRDNRKDIGVKIIADHEAHMRETLEEGLKWFCDEKRGRGCLLVLKLEARFGKVLWKNIPEDVVENALGITKFAELCFTNTKHSRVFNTNVKIESVEAVRAMLKEEKISILETFDIKFTIPGEKERRVDVRVKFEGFRPTVLQAKMNEVKTLVFDVLCLHRKHDVRMTLNYYELLPEGSSEYKFVERLLKTVSHNPDTEEITLQPRADGEWSVNFVRHKKRETYRVDDKLLLTITAIQEYKVDKHPDPLLTLSQKHPHYEIEFHNCLWDCAFGKDADLTPEQSLAVNMENPVLEPEVEADIPHSWQPEDILRDFQEFWESLDTLNDELNA